MARKIYTQDFRETALKRAKEIGKEKAARELGISSQSLYIWQRKLKSPVKEVNQTNVTITRLKNENEYLNKLVRVLVASLDVLAPKTGRDLV